MIVLLLNYLEDWKNFLFEYENNLIQLNYLVDYLNLLFQ
jgi:hypothetical protein